MQKKKGISLIVLVITIIVMIVLAGAIILSLNNAGIIEKANQAVKETDEATVKELAQMAWAEAYADGVRKVETEGDVKGFQDRVTDSLKVNGIDTDKYIIAVNEKGTIVKEKAIAWIQEGLKVVRGEESLEIGQTVKYESGVEEYTGGWKVLGADDEGNLLIMSAADIKTEYLLGSSTLSQAQQEWLSGAMKKLDDECKPYGKGLFAKSARSISINDIDKVTGYDKTTFGAGEVYQYGKQVTYIYNGTLKPAYVGVNGSTGTLTTEHSDGIYWYDEKGFHHVTAAELMLESNKGKEIATIINGYYTYEGISTGKLTADSEAYKMIYGTSDRWNYYWLTPTCTYASENNIYFGIRYVRDGDVRGGILWRSTGYVGNPARGVRAVVTLQHDIPMTSLISQ